MPSNLEVANQLTEMVLQSGADAADVLVHENISLGVACRLGTLEDSERAESRDIGVRAIVGQQQAFVSGSALGENDLRELAKRVSEMANAAPPDPHCGLPSKEDLAGDINETELDLADPHEPSSDELLTAAIATETQARDNPQITNSEGAHAAWSKSTMALANSHGFAAQSSGTSFSLSCAVLAGEGENMQRDYAAHRARHFADLESPQIIGERAATRTIERLHPRKVASRKAPVIFSTRVSASLLGHLSGAISGAAVGRGTSFLRDKLGAQIMSANINIKDDPHLLRGLASSKFDGEGVAPAAFSPIENGTLTNWLLDCASARQLNLASNGRATRGLGSPPHPAATNLYLENGERSLAQLFADIGEGFYVTELIGMGVNPANGDYSRGAAGFWIEGGEPAYAVSEITIASNLIDMFAHLAPANDLEFRGSVNAPSILIEEMSLAGL